MNQVPILFYSDSPDCKTGLGRITRDLASLLSRSPYYRVGVVGKGGTGSRHLPFPQYVIPVEAQWGESFIQKIWKDFAGREVGIIFTIWDTTRLLWFARPDFMQEADPELAKFLSAGHFQKWGYFPIDATGPADRLTSMSHDALLGFHKVLTYTKWAKEVTERTLGPEECRRRHLDWIPHGINEKKFTPKDKSSSRAKMGAYVHDSDTVIGIVGTNQARKDWGLAIASIAGVRPHVRQLRLWLHIDLMERHWSLPALLNDHSLGDCTTITHELTDDELAEHYSACDVTLHPGLGEGFGYPIFESLACGTPVVHGDYGGGADILRQCGHAEFLVPAVAARLDTLHNVVRPVFDPQDWTAKILGILQQQHEVEDLRASVSHLFWANLWPSVWEPYFERMRRTI